MNKTVLVIGIIFLLIGASVVSSTERTVDDYHSNYHPMESNIESKEILSRSNIAYGYISDSGSSGHPEGPCYFYLDDPGNIYSLAPTESGFFLSGGTWTSEGIWYGWEYATGSLWIINPNNGEMTSIGGGAGSCNGLSWDPVYNRLYGISDSALFKIDHETGEQELICRFNGPWYPMGIAFDGNGTLHGWFDNLWIMEACKLTLVGPLGIWAEYGHFDYDTDILYLSTNIPTGQLYKCDKETGNCTLIGDFEGGAEITCLAIPYNNPPDAPIIDGPHYGRPGVLYDFCINGIDPDGDNYYAMWDWGDGTYTNWLGPYVSGEINCAEHGWIESGTYEIRVKLKDVHGLETGWSEPFIIVIEDEEPDVDIISPEKRNLYINFRDRVMLKIPFITTVIIGKIKIEVDASDDISGINRVEIFIDNELRFNDTEEPYNWTWDERAFFRHRITVKAFDKAGNYATDEIKVFKLL